MNFWLKTLFEFLSGCLMVWVAVHFFGAATVALVLAVLAVALVALCLNIANSNSDELKYLRKQVSAIEEERERLHNRLDDQIDSLDQRLHGAIARLDAMTPSSYSTSDF